MKTFKEFFAESIGAAVNDLVDRIRNDGYTRGVEKEVADDWEVNPALLTRMFKKKYNKEPSEMSIDKDETKVIEAAKRAAAAHRNKFTGEFSKYVGRIFESRQKKICICCLDWKRHSCYFYTRSKENVA